MRTANSPACLASDAAIVTTQGARPQAETMRHATEQSGGAAGFERAPAAIGALSKRFEARGIVARRRRHDNARRPSHGGAPFLPLSRRHVGAAPDRRTGHC